MSKQNCKKNPTFPLGTLLWVKLLNRLWWPGTVVDRLTIPQELLDYVLKVEPISAVVKFEEDEKYHVVGLNDEVYLYSCDRKMEFIEKGFSLYKNQLKGLSVIGKFDMNNFKKEVISMERLIGGDICIFENLKEKKETVKSIVKQFFTPTNTKKSKKKEVERKSLPVPKTPKTPKTPNQPKSKSVSKPRTSTQSQVSKTYKPTTSTGYSCHSQVGCNFTTNRYDILKRHIASHKNNDSNIVITKESPTSSTPKNKRKNKTKLSEVKKQKLQEELLKDWDNDGEDEDEELNTSRVQLSSNVAQSSNGEVVQTSEVQSSSIVQSSDKEVVQTGEVQSSSIVQSSNKEVVQTSEVQSSSIVQSSNKEVVQTSEVQSSSNVVQSPNEEIIPTSKVLSSENDVMQASSEDISRNSEVRETSTSSPKQVFDFNENDNNTPVVELRHSRSNCSSTMDDNLSETFESQITSDFINNTIFDATSSESLLAEKSVENSNVKPHETHPNEIDNQIKSTELLLENTDNTLDQISNFENSLNCISNTKNNFDANIQSGGNVVIGVSELSECGSLNNTANLHIDVDIETNGVSIPLVENLSTEIEDCVIVEENTNDKEIVSNNEEVNHLNGTTIDKNIPIENLCSESTSNKIDCEDEITKKKENIDGIPNIKCFENAEWKNPKSELTKATFVQLEEIQFMPPTLDDVPANIDLQTNPKLYERFTFKSEIQDTKQSDYIYNAACELFLPMDLYGRPKMERLTPDANPTTEAFQRAALEKSKLGLNFIEKWT